MHRCCLRNGYTNVERIFAHCTRGAVLIHSICVGYLNIFPVRNGFNKSVIQLQQPKRINLDTLEQFLQLDDSFCYRTCLVPEKE